MQADLFNLSLSNSFERDAFNRSFFEKKYTLRLDQLLGGGLVLIVFFVLVFAWGVERGKSVSQREFMLKQTIPAAPSFEAKIPAAAPIIALETPVSASQSIPPTVEIVTETKTTAVSPEAPPADSSAAFSASTKYTIAHITYVKKEQAAHEIKRIQSKGYESFMVSSGRYFQVCVSGFDSRKGADQGIKNLRMKGIVSGDSYIRNMPA